MGATQKTGDREDLRSFMYLIAESYSSAQVIQNQNEPPPELLEEPLEELPEEDFWVRVTLR